MTTILAIQSEHGVTLAWESMGTQGGHSFDMDTSKAFVNNGTVFLFAGTVRDLNLIRFADLPACDTWDTERWVTTALIPAIREALDAAGALVVDNGVVSMESGLLAVVQGRVVFEIESNFGWARRDDGLFTGGSGYGYALGALSAGASAREAIEVAIRHDSASGGQIHVHQAAELLDEHYQYEERLMAA